MAETSPSSPPPVALPAPAAPYPHATTRFAPGDIVRVRTGRGPGHVRTPWYVRGRTGRVERLCGAFANPEHLAYHRDGLPAAPLYRVRFWMADLWGAGTEQAGDTLDVEIYEHWLEAAHAP